VGPGGQEDTMAGAGDIRLRTALGRTERPGPTLDGPAPVRVEDRQELL